MSRRALGHLVGNFDPTDKPIAALVGARRAGASGSSSMLPLLDGYFDQGQSEACEGWGWLNGLFLRGRVLGLSRPRGSARALWDFARELDAGAGAPIANVGTYARTVRDVLATDGIVPESVYPWEDGNYGAKPPWGVLQQAAADRITIGDAAAILSSGAERIADIGDALDKGFPISFGMQVDDAYMAGKFGTTWGGALGDVAGWHCQTIVGQCEDYFQVLNSWGVASWNGFGWAWIPRAFFGTNACADFWCVEVSS